MRKKFVLGLAALATLGAATAIGVDPASAALTTTCRGEAGAVTVPGDLVVPANASCELDGTTIEGNVRVAANADLLLTDVTINGSTVVAQNGYVDAVDSSFGGTLTLTAAYGAYLETSSVTGRALTRGNASVAEGGFLYTLDSSFADNVQSNAGEVYVEDSEITGGLTSTGSAYTDVYGSWIDGNVTVRSSADGSVFCGVVVGGTSRFLDNTGPIQLGANGPAAECDQDSFWGGNVTVSGTSGDSFVDQNIVNGVLTLSGNDPVTNVGPNNRVRGGVNGESAEWDGTSAPSSAERRMAVASASADRSDAIKSKAEQRLAAGETRAVGKAF